MIRFHGVFPLAASLFVASSVLPAVAASPDPNAAHDLVFHNGIVYDGSGAPPYSGDIAIDADRISYVGPRHDLHGRTEVDVKGQAIAPGFINMLAHPEESLFADGRALSDLSQGVTLEVMGEFSMGPLNETMKRQMADRQGDIKFPVTWTTLGEYMETIERRGIGPNVASFVGAPTVRTFVLGERDVQPSPQQMQEDAEAGSPGDGGWSVGRHYDAYLCAG
jgi:N-acyl-D-amino-acid deacylase